MIKFKVLVVKFFVLVFLLQILIPIVSAPNLESQHKITSEQCHVANIFFEAKGEPIKGKQAVYEVVENRVKAKGYPSTACKVIFQHKQFSWTHQQSFAEIEKRLQGYTTDLNKKDRQAYQEAQLIAYTSDNARLKVLPDGTLFYHSKDVKPLWSKKFKQVKIVGWHIFYKKV